MSVSEEQVKTWVRQEVRRVIDTGLFYTAEVDKEAKTQPSPFKHVQAEAPKPKEVFLSPKLDEILKYERDENGVMYAKAKNHLDTNEFKAVCADIEELGGKYVKGKGWELP
jgi:hypothetical protein